MPNQMLVDSSFLFTLYDLRDERRKEVIAFLTRERSERIVPDVVLTEVTYLLDRSGGQHAVRVFLRSFTQSNMRLQSLTIEDLNRVETIMEKYSDVRFDFVDCCIMALAERLNITQICTFDRRDFTIYRPEHGEHFDLLP